ncbi:MAG: class I SAM-dependent methyltransferase [Sulfuritalea sp.]|nr:class I SAM-dependent methyltransferase [Sulfuritalea sp.]
MDASPLDKLRAFWNQRYADQDFAYGTEPNDFLTGVTPRFAPGGAVLCLADGEGRNGVWLARQGFAVTSVDIADRGLNKALGLAARHGVSIETRVADLGSCELGSEAWDAIVSVFLHLPSKVRRDLHRRCVAALRPGGFMAFEAYGPGQPQRGTGGPKEPELLVALEDLAQEFPGCTTLHRFAGLRDVLEGSLHNGLGEVVQILVQKAAR